MLHDPDESVQRLLRLCLSRLNHDSLMEQQREIDCRGMESVVKKPLRYVKCSDTRRLVCKTIENEFMLAYGRDRKLEAVLQRLLDIVCTKD